MGALSHEQIWSAIDAIAARLRLSPSALARRAGLDPTSFNPSKRAAHNGGARPRWLSTESIAKVLKVTGVSFAEFAALAQGGPRPESAAVPLISLAKAQKGGCFDEAGRPSGRRWRQLAFPALAGEGAYALEISGDAMAPVYRDGDRLVVSPESLPRRGDRAVISTVAGEVLTMEVVKISQDRVQLRPLGTAGGGRTLVMKDVAWIARIIWVSQ